MNRNAVKENGVDGDETVAGIRVREPIVRSTPTGFAHMANTRHTPPQSAAESVDSDFERQLDDLDDLDDDDCFESLDDLAAFDELERLGGFSESTSFDDPPAE